MSIVGIFPTIHFLITEVRRKGFESHLETHGGLFGVRTGE
jgi:hypothetical protein